MKNIIQRIIPITLAITMCLSVNVFGMNEVGLNASWIRKDMTHFVQTMYYEPRERINNVWLYDDSQSPSYRLSSVKDYIVEYKNNQMPGTATITFTGVGDYTGTFSKTFKIVKMPIANITTKASYNDKKALIVSANSGSEDLVYGKDFTVTSVTDIDGNVTVKFYGMGDRYTGSCTKTIKAKDNPNPAPRSYLKDVVITKHKNIKGKKIELKWKKIKHIAGYQLRYSKKASFKGATKVVLGPKDKIYITKKLKKKKTYYKES